ncbi:Hypothetical protein ETEE_0495 [Edwardsiella anguillarum ET080813]|uniref:Uncharacterized protein n=1 Tax=Edwardsiella anguillarum ET080813 TaxID=667120 RepID=A0A076LK60_9GAMM|nr:Hypothetical protein ETEE_0495 [Edwardsiella anguillarum ET080813]
MNIYYENKLPDDRLKTTRLGVPATLRASIAADSVRRSG